MTTVRKLADSVCIGATLLGVEYRPTFWVLATGLINRTREAEREP